MEDYLMVVLGFGAKHSDAAVNLDTLVRRRLEKNLRLKRELAAGYDASGGTTIPFDRRKLEKLFAMIAQALAWHHWGVLLKPGFSTIAALFNDAGAPFFAQMLSGWKTPIRLSSNLGAGTFAYEGAQATDVPEATIWRFQMYGGITFGGDPAVPGPASLAVAVTGPDSLIQRLQSRGYSARRGVSEAEIAVHAYYHWERRGRPFGSPDADWYWAIEDLKHAPLSVGVLVIGSLYWRGGGRETWRRCRLDMNGKWRVQAPIQYGRRSKNETFTMVFSQLSDGQFGQAIIVPCQREVSSPADLIAEAEWLWSAEDNEVPSRCSLPPKPSISAEWGGCVALLRNPQSNVPQEVLDGWAERVLREQHYNANDRRRVDCKGTLLIDWPHLSEGGPVPLDLLLATSNDPEPAYPTVQEIADAWNREPDNERRGEYFRRNKENGIHTFQDHAIGELLR
ncbi:MAG: DUF2934 domain-containing protein [Candidatus Acidiferrales bacterium]